MLRRSLLKFAIFIALSLTISACSSSGIQDRAIAPTDIDELSRSISALGPEIDPEEAQRAADISFRYAKQLAGEYNVTDAPLIHNTKVNMNLRPRGLCYHWADDLEARLRRENFKTLELHRAIANATSIRIEHSTLIVSRSGGDMFDGIVLDGWRNGGALYWAPTRQDDHYTWVPREVVFAQRRAKEARN